LRYKANITAGALFVPESRKIAELMLAKVDSVEWKQVTESQNILQRLSPASSIRIANLIRSRLRLMTPDLWELIKDEDSTTSTQACLAAAIKHCRILGDYLDIVVRRQFNRLEDRLTPRLWEDFVLGCRQRDPEMNELPSTTAKKMRTNIHRILNEAGYLGGGRKWLLQRVDILPKIIRHLKDNDEEYILKCMQLTK
jgi:hypothetical protein